MNNSTKHSYEAIKNGSYSCFLDKDTALPMLFMPDAIKATVDLMEAKASKISVHNSYNIGGLSVTPGQISDEIIKQIPDFKIEYKPDFRQTIAETWPQGVDDSVSTRDWGYEHRYDLQAITEIMLEEIKQKLNLNILR